METKLPISEKQMMIMAFPYTKYDALICDGAIRSGKTTFMIKAFIDDAMRRFNNQRFGICGKTVDSTVKNIIMPYMSMTGPKEDYSIQWRRTDKILVVTAGDTENYFEVFGGKDESSFALIQGRTLAGVLFDEVALQPRSFVEQALARCSVEGSRLWFNCNPGPPTHWFYTEWIQQPEKHNALHLHFELTDNPSLSEKIIARYESMYEGVFYRRYIKGEWCVAEGLVYAIFNKEWHVTEDLPKYDRHKAARFQYYISIDYGTLNPFSMGLWCLHKGVAYRIREWYHDGRKSGQKTDSEYYAAIEKLAGDLPIESIIIDPSAASMITEIMRRGKYTVTKARNDVIPGISYTAALLQAGWDSECAEKDKVIKEYDHAMDDIRYFAYTILRREFVVEMGDYKDVED